MTKHNGLRKQFMAALVLADLTIAEWADREGKAPNHVSMVLNGRRESARLTERMREFAQQTLRAATSKKVAA